MDPKDLLGATGIKICDLGVLILLEFWLLWHYRKDFYGKICLTSLWVKTSKTQKPFISYRPYSGDLLILMPRIRILHFLGPESDIDIYYKIAHCHPLIWKVKTRNLQIWWTPISILLSSAWYLQVAGPTKVTGLYNAGFTKYLEANGPLLQ